MPAPSRGTNNVYSVHASKMPKAFDPKLKPGDIYFLSEEHETYVVASDRDLVLVAHVPRGIEDALAVHAHPPGGDQILGVAPGGDP